jgi:hypothetical protein
VPAIRSDRGHALRALPAVPTLEDVMNEDAFNMSVRKFLKKVGVTAQREIEQAVRDAAAKGRLKGHEPLIAKASVSVAGLNLNFEVDGAVEFE